MDTTVLEIAARSAGALPSAIDDVVRRLSEHFAAQASPSPELVSQQLAQLRESAPHLFPRADATTAAGVPVGLPESVWRSMSPSSKLAWSRQHQPMKPVERRPDPSYRVPESELASFAGLSPAEALTRFRQLRDSQRQGGA